MDFEELLPQQQSFDADGGVSERLDRSTSRSNGHPQRYTGAYVTDASCGSSACRRCWAATSRRPTTQPGAEKVAIIGYGDLAARLRRRRRTSSARASGSTASRRPIVGVMPQGFAFPTNEELWLPLYQRVPAAARSDPAAISPAVLGLLKAGVSLDQANAEFDHDRQAVRGRLSRRRTNSSTPARSQPLIETFTPRPLRGTLLDDARVLRGRAADRVRQRDEHAVRARARCAPRSWRSARRSARRAAG